jgi:TRAP-type C4-dicarboxylate transport system permease small subunit
LIGPAVSDRGTTDVAATPDREPLVAWTRPLAIAGGLLMLAASLVVLTSVLMRWLMQTSFAGAIELMQIATALAVFSFLPLCQAARGNIMVDTFTARLPLRFRNGLDALWDLVYAGMTGIIAWRLVIGAWDTLRSNTVSMMLSLPIGWAIAACAVMAAFLTVIAVATAFYRLGNPR